MRQKVLTQNLFRTPRDASSWTSLATSGVLHAIAILALFFLLVPSVRDAARPAMTRGVTLLSPVLPRHTLKAQPRAVWRELSANNSLPRNVSRKSAELPKEKPALKEPIRQHLPALAAAPDVKPAPVYPTLPEVKQGVAVKPAIRTDSFAQVDATRMTVKPKLVQMGSFGDAQNMPTKLAANLPTSLAKVGGFDSSVDAQARQSGAHGRIGISASGFENAITADSSGPAHTQSAGVRTGEFGETAPMGPSGALNRATIPTTPTSTPVALLFKPKPAYTEEARNLKLQGQVTLAVTFLSDGTIKILRVLESLGHGLDEAAAQAASQVRFKPATRGGVAVDAEAIIKINFQLTE